MNLMYSKLLYASEILDSSCYELHSIKALRINDNYPFCNSLRERDEEKKVP